MEVSTDDGQTWTTELSMTRKEAEDAADGVETGCGGDPFTRLLDLAVLPVEDGTEVAVAAKHGGVLLRSPSGEWRRSPPETLEAMRRSRGDGDRHRVDRDGPQRAAAGLPHTRGAELPVAPAGPPCPSPTRRTVTPNPSNGPPTSYDVCP